MYVCMYIYMYVWILRSLRIYVEEMVSRENVIYSGRAGITDRRLSLLSRKLRGIFW